MSFDPELVRPAVPIVRSVSGRHYQLVRSYAQLAASLGAPIWAPKLWPPAYSGPDLLVSFLEGGNLDGREYLLRGIGVNSSVLVVLGRRRFKSGRLRSELRLLPGERLETWIRSWDQRTHIVVRTDVFDVHILGSIESTAGLAISRSLGPVGVALT